MKIITNAPVTVSREDYETIREIPSGLYLDIQGDLIIVFTDEAHCIADGYLFAYSDESPEGITINDMCFPLTKQHSVTLEA